MAKKKAKDKNMETAPKKGRQYGQQAGGPYWHKGHRQWYGKLHGKFVYAPKSIGEADIKGATDWFRGFLEKSGFPLGERLPGTEVSGGLRKLSITLTPEIAANLRELDPLIASEQFSAATNYSRTIGVAISEALASRKKGKG